MEFLFVESEKLMKDCIQYMKIQIEQENRYDDTHHVLTEPCKKQRCCNEGLDHIIKINSLLCDIIETLPNSLVVGDDE